MGQKDISSLRSTTDFLKEQKQIISVTKEVDPVLEIAGITNSVDGGGPALLFENIKGYPGVRGVGNLFGTRERTAAIFGVDDAKKFKFKCLDAMNNPIPPRIVQKAPCQEVVITKDIDVMKTLPILKHSAGDCGRILGGGILLFSGKTWHGGTDICYKRMHFMGKDWASILFGSKTHTNQILTTELRNQRVPVTISISPSPAVQLTAAVFWIHARVPQFTDELAIAGGLQGSPVELCRAKTVDAYSIADAEWVIEGYINTAEKIWESPESEKLGEADVLPFFPEWTGYLGRAGRAFKFEATAITHREDRPIFDGVLANGINNGNLMVPFREACYYELAEREEPGLLVDVNIFRGLAPWNIVVLQLKKRRPRDEGTQRDLLTTILAVSPGMRVAIAVDEDIDIYSPEDVLWAVGSRLDPKNLYVIPHGRGTVANPMERAAAGPTAKTGGADFMFAGGLAIDATVPYSMKWLFERGRYATYNKNELRKWFSATDLAALLGAQSDYGKVLAGVEAKLRKPQAKTQGKS